MTPSGLRLIGIIFMVIAAALMILNLRRVANLGTFWIGLPLFIIGVACLARARRARF